MLEATVEQSGFPSAVGNYIFRRLQLCHLQEGTFKKLQVRSMFLNLFIYTFIGKPIFKKHRLHTEEHCSRTVKVNSPYPLNLKSQEEKSLQKLKY